MAALPELLAEARFVLGLPAFVRRRLTLEQAQETVARRLDDREGLFARLLSAAVYECPSSPYLWLLRRAGVERPAVLEMLGRDGLDDTLGALHRAGVRVSFEEFKGRVPIVRDGAELPVTASSFDNPTSRRRYSGATTGGSTGVPMRLALDLDHVAARAPAMMLSLAAHGVLDAPTALWRSILPAIAGLSSVLRGIIMGSVPERWFSPLAPAELSAPWKHRLATGLVVRCGRFAGAPLPRPEHVPFDRAVVVAEWAHGAVARRGRALVRGHVSTLARVATAAIESGIDLSGVLLWGGGEPPTPAKLALIAESGATYRPTYFLSEAGAIGLACVAPADPTEVHAMEDAIALVAQAASGPHRMLWITTLLPTAPKVMLNVESDDVAIVERRACGCALEGAGFRTHLRQVSSGRKLTSEGMRVLGVDVLALVDDLLPGAFGGSSLCYQVAEEEDAAGQTRVVIIVDPSVALPAEETVVARVLELLGSGGGTLALAASTWRQASSVIVRREAPRWTGQGKLPLLRTAAHGTPRGTAA